MLVDRRDELTRARVQAANRLHRLLAELVPGQRKKEISTGQAKTIIASVRPRDVAGKTRRRLAVEQVTELSRSGKTRAEAMRCLKRRISDALYRRLRADAASNGMDAGPGGHRGASHKSSAAGSHPHTGASDQPLPGPATTTLPVTTTTGKTTAGRSLEPAP